MAENPFDKASRFAAKLNPVAFLGWAIDQPPHAFTFDGWIDTRNLPFPGDRTAPATPSSSMHEPGLGVTFIGTPRSRDPESAEGSAGPTPHATRAPLRGLRVAATRSLFDANFRAQPRFGERR